MPRRAGDSSTPAGDGAHIVVEGAREHNLAEVSVRIPKRCLTMVTGVSGSGKSSLVVGTIAAEAQRQLHETYPAFVRDRLPRHARPRATRIDHLTPVVVVDQRPVSGNARSTVGTMTEISTALRILFSRAGDPSAGESSAYSFNDPAGMCERCEGLGRERRLRVDRLIDDRRSLNEGAIRFPAFAVGTWQWQLYADTGLVDPDVPVGALGDADREVLLHGSGFKVQRGTRLGRSTVGNAYDGVVTRFERHYLRRDPRKLSADERAALADVVEDGPCSECGGQRVNAAARASRIGGRNIAELSALEAVDLARALEGLRDPDVAPLVEAALAGLRRIEAVGLGYLSLDRPTPTLSGGEAQRLKTVRHLGSSLTDMTYVFDEPSIGLHPHDVARLTALLGELRDKGNTVLVVEHDPDVIAIADHVVDLGPDGGDRGGRVVFEGSVAELARAGTRTARALSRPRAVKERPRRPRGALTIRDARRHNLRGLTVDVPTGVLTAVTGLAGSGKSTLVGEVLPEQHDGVVVIDQSPVARSSRAMIATYVGAFDRIRRRFAEASGAEAGLFSANSVGACPVCEGRGTVTTDLAYLAPVTRTCERCGGTRYRPEALEHRWHGLTIVDVLDMTAGRAADTLDDDAVRARMRRLVDVGLDHLTLGRALGTLSGGERQRLKIADRIDEGTPVLVLDEPSTGLHLDDIDGLLAVLDRLVDGGSTVVVIEHDLDVIRHADWVIDLGPGAGRHGGELVFAGTPADLLGAEGSLTAEHLRRHVGAQVSAPRGAGSGPPCRRPR
ncbi:MAG TPA: ATP-binding cassette domain-containing protein [Capillimicrobium sp.]